MAAQVKGVCVAVFVALLACATRLIPRPRLSELR